MGRTLQTANQLLRTEQQAFVHFRRALRRHDQQRFDALFAKASQHLPAISQANHALPFEAILLAMLIEQQREIEQLAEALARRDAADHA